MIDKKISFFWGNTPMSWMRYMTLYSFRKMNPDWEINLYLSESKTIHKVWDNENIQDFFNYNGADYINKIDDLRVNIIPWSLEDRHWNEISPSQKSNFFKWWLLANHSGYYADLDILFVKPLETFYENTKDYETIMCYSAGYFSIGFMASSGDNKIFSDIYEHGFKCFNDRVYQTAGVENLRKLLRDMKNEPKYWVSNQPNYWSVLEQNYPDNKICNHGMDLVYPFDSDNINAIFNKKIIELPEACIGIHWYAGSDLSQFYNNMLTEQNYGDYLNTFSHFLKEVLSEV